MKKTLIFSLLFLFLMSLITAPGFSQKASDILEKMIETQGGRKLLEAIKDSTITGTIEMIQFGMNGSLTMYQKEPNKMRMDIEVMGMVITQAFDGETAWWVNPQTGSSEEMPEKQSEDMKRQALGNDSLLNPAKYGITYTFKGKETIEEKDYLVLEQTYSDGFKATLYIDPQTYLTYKTKGITTNQMGVEVEGETYFSDYKKVEGMMIPYSLTIFQDGEEFMKMTVTEATFNSGLEDDLFKMSEAGCQI